MIKATSEKCLVMYKQSCNHILAAKHLTGNKYIYARRVSNPDHFVQAFSRIIVAGYLPG